MCYRETKNPAYLAQAEHIAYFYPNHPNLLAGKIPYWRFNAPDMPAAKRDASAGAVAASGLLELSQYSKAPGPRYFRAAVQILSGLSSPAYRAAVGQNQNFVLRHSVGHLPAKAEVDVPLVYADCYYYIEGLLRYDRRRVGKPSTFWAAGYGVALSATTCRVAVPASPIAAGTATRHWLFYRSLGPAARASHPGAWAQKARAGQYC